MKIAKILVLIIAALVIGGCADSGTRGDNSERDYSRLVVINDNSGTIELKVELKASSDTDTATKQDTRNQATVSPRTSAALYGSTAQLAEQGAETFMKGVTSLYQQWQEAKNETQQNNPANTQESVLEASPSGNQHSADDSAISEGTNSTPPAVSTRAAESSETPANTEVIEMTPIDNRSFAWLKYNGGHYGASGGTFVFDNECGVFEIVDMGVTAGADFDSSNRQQAYYFSGNDFKVGDEEYNEGRGSVFTAPNCTSKTAILTYGN